MFCGSSFIDRTSPKDTASISPGLDLPEHGFGPFTVPSCGLRVFYTGTAGNPSPGPGPSLDRDQCRSRSPNGLRSLRTRMPVFAPSPHFSRAARSGECSQGSTTIGSAMPVFPRLNTNY